MNEFAMPAIQSVLTGKLSFCKFLSGNDTGNTGAHQAGILISKSASSIMFNEPLVNSGITDRWVKITWQNDITTDSRFIYYSSKKELRITNFGKGFPYLKPEQTGALFVFIKFSDEDYKGYFLNTEDEINQFLDAFGIGPTETNTLIEQQQTSPEMQEQMAMNEFIAGLSVDFPTSDKMSEAARHIHDLIYNHKELIRINPDKKLIDWTDTEYRLFRALEHARYGNLITNGFSTVEDFINTANQVLNRRKSRAGKSLEHHLSAIFNSNGLMFKSQAITEGNKKPDFLFPSQEAYHDMSFSTDNLISLAAKTTCKDRWRQIINEADRLKGKPKYLCTLQQGISPAQMDEMQAEQVILVVPKPYIITYPKERRDRIWTLNRFIKYVKEVENRQ
jgi:3'-phosphoadenosine 5'-phosphosulfate sulfotransferase (PAPS reductase)/FAD synthetase